MPGSKVIEKLGILLFGAIIIFGEAFKLNLGFAKLSLPLVLVCIIFLFVCSRGLRFYKTLLDKAIYLYGFVSILFTAIGILYGNSLSDIFEDLYPILVFVFLFVVWRSLTVDQFSRMWNRTMLFSILAALKVVIIAIVPFQVLWDNNWQATKEPLPLDGFYRIILRGGDAFLSFALVYLLINVQQKTAGRLVRNLLLIGLLVVAVFISLSRSSFLGIALGLFLTLLFFHTYFSTKKLALFSSGIIGILLLLLPFFNTISLAASIFEARTDAFDADNISVDFRKEERSLILKKAAATYYMGNGLGSYIYLDLSGSDKKDERSIYAHDFNTWLIFKTGVTGLALFYFILFNCTYNLYWCLRQKTALHKNHQLMILSLFACGIVIVTVSFLANKLSTISGSVFFAFYAAASMQLKKTYERSI